MTHAQLIRAVAVETSLLGRPRAAETIARPLDALADAEGPTDSLVMIEAVGPGRTAVRWESRGILQVREYAVPDLGSVTPFPEPPQSFSAMPSSLLDAPNLSFSPELAISPFAKDREPHY